MKPDIVRALLIDKMHARTPAKQGPETGLVLLPDRGYDAPQSLYQGHYQCR